MKMYWILFYYTLKKINDFIFNYIFGFNISGEFSINH